MKEGITTTKKNYAIKGMTCASCVNTIEKYVINQGGIADISVNLLSEEAEIEFDPNIVSDLEAF